MAEMISLEDLAMYRDALLKAQQAERGLQQLQQAQHIHIAAVGALRFVSTTLAARYQLGQTGTFNQETGEIYRDGQPAVPPEPVPELALAKEPRRKK